MNAKCAARTVIQSPSRLLIPSTLPTYQPPAHPSPVWVALEWRGDEAGRGNDPDAICSRTHTY